MLVQMSAEVIKIFLVYGFILAFSLCLVRSIKNKGFKSAVFFILQVEIKILKFIFLLDF